METYASVEETIKQNIEYEVLMKNDRNDHELIQGICKLIVETKAMYLSCAPENILILSFTLFIKISPFFQFLFLSNFLHLKSANIIIVSCR